jgi:hypothetical protein
MQLNLVFRQFQNYKVDCLQFFATHRIFVTILDIHAEYMHS